MLVLIKPERQTCLGVCGRSTLRWFQIFTLLSLLGACGRVHDTGGSQLASITHEGEEGTLSGHRLAQNILSFSSELRHFAQQDLQERFQSLLQHAKARSATPSIFPRSFP